jgi:hypothetical protein
MGRSSQASPSCSAACEPAESRLATREGRAARRVGRLRHAGGVGSVAECLARSRAGTAARTASYAVAMRRPTFSGARKSATGQRAGHHADENRPWRPGCRRSLRRAGAVPAAAAPSSRTHRSSRRLGRTPRHALGGNRTSHRRRFVAGRGNRRPRPTGASGPLWRPAMRCVKLRFLQAFCRWRDPDSNRGHHDFQSCGPGARMRPDLRGNPGLPAILPACAFCRILRRFPRRYGRRRGSSAFFVVEALTPAGAVGLTRPGGVFLPGS